MGLLKKLVDLLAGLIAPFPLAVQPGLFLAVGLMLLWLVLKRGRVLWNWGIRTTTLLIGSGTGLVLYPEYVHTTTRRRSGASPSSVAIGVTPMIDRVLDGVSDAYTAHPRTETKALGCPPIAWAVVLCVCSVVLYYVARRPDGQAVAPLADAVFTNWASLRRWAGA
jgi:hypothetical protein